MKMNMILDISIRKNLRLQNLEELGIFFRTLHLYVLRLTCKIVDLQIVNWKAINTDHFTL